MNVLDPLLALLPLDRLPRTGWVLAGVDDPESIAGHLVGTACVALAVAPRIEPALRLERVLVMALLHDAPEARTGDLPRSAARHLPAGAKATMEGRLADELLGPLGEEAVAAWREYRSNETREARFVHVCDELALGVRLVGYRRAGRRGLGGLGGGLETLDCGEFPPAEELRREILDALEAS